MANEKVLKGPYWTRNWIEAMWRFTNENFVNFDTGAVDYEALGREEFQFRKALFFRNFKNSERAKVAFDTADEDYKRPVENGKKGGRPKKIPQDAPNGNAGVDVTDTGNGAASKSPTSCDTLTADGDIREDSQAKPDGSAISRNETRAFDALGPSANHYTADAPAREDGDGRNRTGNGVASESRTSANHYGPRQAKISTGEALHSRIGEDNTANTDPGRGPEPGNIYGDAATREGAEVAVPTTVSRNMRRVPQNEAPAHGFSGGRTAQGTMSRSPEAAAQSGKAYAKTRDTRDDSRGRYAPPSCSPEDGNPAETAPSHGGSVASLEDRQRQALESRRTGGSSVRGMAKVAQPSVRSRASFRNKEDFIQWAIDDGLDPVDAGECWEATEERGGKDADGNTVKNMKAFARQWCRTRANNRRTA